ncbi:sugar-transfer associated ATP-grasp domain-containing protein [Natronolimnohabitans sp. A-GB9]|uniref:sugar-transfer associated ATP-grasp domain-containing protein n=1 Tax=Natronolimnohabitans sp. A-GB9 TaxID=3069757 RepID=UPI0027B2942F|nr:sugar-transfer associated ATP-grasp domain-containing protein [Natronolimnohabitans sp. A-GB9]MDQ2052700.1 sugar-transfer associated ATP-grasp domain-containing protein [Natronolimnohabitans sp. A-GB9]
MDVLVEARNRLKRCYLGFQERAESWGSFAGREIRNTYSSQVPLRQRLEWWRRGFLTSSMFLYDFDNYDPEDYLNDIQYYKRLKANGDEKTIATHKFVFDRLLRYTHSEYLPDLYAVIRDGTVLDPEMNVLSNDIGSWVTETIKPSEKLVFKPENGNGGNDVFIVGYTDSGVTINDEPSKVDDLSGRISDGDYIVTGFVEQADYADELYSDSTNTIRVVTFWDYDKNEPYVADAIHRIGTDESRPVDNWDNRGLSAGIDLERGVLQKATRDPDSPELEWFSEHPDTGAQIEGVEIPYWDKICSATCEMADSVWYLPMNAWDVVVTDDGLQIIEGNSRPTLNMMQVHRPLLVDERNRRFLEHHDIL